MSNFIAVKPDAKLAEAPLESSVLVLNQNYQPLNICNGRRAIMLLIRGKAELLIQGKTIVRTISHAQNCPSVIRILYMVKRPVIRYRLSRMAIFHRDSFTCQYCGIETPDLTIDHIVPRSKGGPHTWENVVASCGLCNHKKAGLTPKQARLRMPPKPASPRPNPYYLFVHQSIQEEWKPFIPWLNS